METAEQLQVVRMEGVLAAAAIRPGDTEAVGNLLEETLGGSNRSPASKLMYAAAVLDQHPVTDELPPDTRNRLRSLFDEPGQFGSATSAVPEPLIGLIENLRDAVSG